ncbi:MAG: type II toxin-antitoxin system Phd/YefM family antitoxin [Candidatus Dadabacteria bacterium]|nr:type II toxin-antitoxin system Phd/YefM family antitoxin [Candidatus Dadabacteria bacterium]NIS07558.1 type II toxin-antitoxin system Phd/YefM family antitoxin [Candidatus Dadabacteria bacterium]NIY21173.1 type II toxin-antitoxin system prevent-host-death family antitoxin [Candidatus Dadabacteria bacterium]
MTRVTIKEAQILLSELIEKVSKGEEILITIDNKPVVMLVLIDEMKPERRLDSAKGLVVISDDFDHPLKDFRHYAD